MRDRQARTRLPVLLWTGDGQLTRRRSPWGRPPDKKFPAGNISASPGVYRVKGAFQTRERRHCMEDTELLLRNAMEHHGAAVYRLALCRMQSVQDAEDV